ncbi:MAG: hypothetical protein D3923_06260 [Candidatus Electrothrix sp. AR3]|nr:hypothetical protein [Candidatus Electrothrix sp. AR3]
MKTTILFKFYFYSNLLEKTKKTEIFQYFFTAKSMLYPDNFKKNTGCINNTFAKIYFGRFMTREILWK